jgi:hypothetical protein
MDLRAAAREARLISARLGVHDDVTYGWLHDLQEPESHASNVLAHAAAFPWFTVYLDLTSTSHSRSYPRPAACVGLLPAALLAVLVFAIP